MRSRVWAGMLLLVACGLSMAAGNTEYRRVASLVVTGTIDIDAAGKVTAHSIDHPRRLNQAVVKLIDETVPQWLFEPLPAGADVRASRGRLILLITGKQVAENEYAVRIERAHVGASEHELARQNVSAVAMAKPEYPKAALKSGVTGTVYLMLRVDRGGRVTDAIAEQVNLDQPASEPEMTRDRDVLAGSALAAAKRWTFRPPRTGKLVDAPFWSVRVPIRYRAFGETYEYGQWEAYIPGPRQPIPWADANDKEAFASSPEGLVAGQVALVGDERKLLTALGTD